MKRVILLVFLFGMTGFLVACGNTEISPEAGQNLAVIKGCAACHDVEEASSVALSPKIGPSWVGLYGSEVELKDGTFVIADEAYLIESTKDPNAKIVKGYTKGAMPPISLTEDELNAVVAFIKSLE